MAFPSCLAYINQIVLAVSDNTDRSPGSSGEPFSFHRREDVR